ncbi:MAG: flagellar type III secretion system pore protein FliP [Candidatus Eremiobacteraeota bacterium]|nr:flagellar type III secretion system pore protein FliP [Candidatus Eremiobacteraeota bacterium]
MDSLLTVASHARATLPLDVLIALTALAIAPFLFVMTTSFVRIVVVLSLVRSAIGAAALPPNTVLTGMAFVITLVVMLPTWTAIDRSALQPYARGKLSTAQALERAAVPLRSFMLRQTRTRDLELFARIAHRPLAATTEAPLFVVLPAFVVGELRAAFAIGLSLYLPFVAIDLAVASILMGLGMFMLSPPVVSLPAKLLLFVMVDGWALVCGGVVSSFR